MNARKLALALLPLLAVAAACERADEEPPDSCAEFAGKDLTPTADPIEITLGPDGIRVDPDPAYVSRRGGSLAWRSPDRPFVLAFHHRAGALPFGRVPRAARPDGPVSLTVDGSPPCGRYKYSVVVWDATGDSMVVLDPEYMLIP